MSYEGRTPQQILDGGAAWVTETELSHLVERLESWRGDAFKANARANKLQKAMREFSDEISEPTFDDSRIEWVEVQIDRDALAEFRELARMGA